MRICGHEATRPDCRVCYLAANDADYRGRLEAPAAKLPEKLHAGLWNPDLKWVELRRNDDGVWIGPDLLLWREEEDFILMFHGVEDRVTGCLDPVDPVDLEFQVGKVRVVVFE